MKNIKKYLITLLLGIDFATFTQAQYKAAFGVRFIDGPAISAKFSTGGNEAAEALLGGFGRGLKATLMYQWHNPAFDSNQWRWYYGAGGHMGASPYRRWYRDRPAPAADFHIGIDGILGIEHTFDEIPVNISADWKPEFNFVNYTGLVLPVFGVTARLAL